MSKNLLYREGFYTEFAEGAEELVRRQEPVGRDARSLFDDDAFGWVDDFAALQDDAGKGEIPFRKGFVDGNYEIEFGRALWLQPWLILSASDDPFGGSSNDLFGIIA